MTRLAIMQPYFFPYLGYWQLIHAVDRFVVYDDVNYIKGGWINRNRILINGEPRYLTVPLDGLSPHKRICDTLLQPGARWRSRLVKSVEMAYAKSPHFPDIFPVVKSIIEFGSSNLADYLLHHTRLMCELLGIATDLVASSRGYRNDPLRGQTRVIDICRKENADVYVNSPGGAMLYDADEFSANGVLLKFIRQPDEREKAIDESEFRLSIIHALMQHGSAAIRQKLKDCAVATAGETGPISGEADQTIALAHSRAGHLPGKQKITWHDE